MVWIICKGDVSIHNIQKKTEEGILKFEAPKGPQNVANPLKTPVWPWPPPLHFCAQAWLFCMISKSWKKSDFEKSLFFQDVPKWHTRDSKWGPWGRHWSLGARSLKLDIWNLKFEFWNLELEPWALKLETCNLNLGAWQLKLEDGHLKFELWNLWFGIWNLQLKAWSLHIETWNLKLEALSLQLVTWNLKLETWNLKVGNWNWPLEKEKKMGWPGLACSWLVLAWVGPWGGGVWTKVSTFEWPSPGWDVPEHALDDLLDNASVQVLPEWPSPGWDVPEQAFNILLDNA